MSDQQCALWYWRYHALHYDICDSEAEAASLAVSTEEYGEGVPVGVQFPDGRTVRVEAWLAYREAQEKARAREDAAAEASRAEAQKPKRQIKDPFDGKPLEIDADEPEWLGE